MNENLTVVIHSNRGKVPVCCRQTPFYVVSSMFLLRTVLWSTTHETGQGSFFNATLFRHA